MGEEPQPDLGGGGSGVRAACTVAGGTGDAQREVAQGDVQAVVRGVVAVGCMQPVCGGR